jgi:hypothetical protein
LRRILVAVDSPPYGRANRLSAPVSDQAVCLPATLARDL